MTQPSDQLDDQCNLMKLECLARNTENGGLAPKMRVSRLGRTTSKSTDTASVSSGEESTSEDSSYCPVELPPAGPHLDVSAHVVKTFIHFQDEPPKMRRSVSLPADLDSAARGDSDVNVSEDNEAIRQTVRQLHEENRCRPCLFFAFKEDQCRAGEACVFCHDCTREEILSRRKQYKLAARESQNENKRKARRVRRRAGGSGRNAFEEDAAEHYDAWAQEAQPKEELERVDAEWLAPVARGPKQRSSAGGRARRAPASRPAAAPVRGPSRQDFCAGDRRAAHPAEAPAPPTPFATQRWEPSQMPPQMQQPAPFAPEPQRFPQQSAREPCEPCAPAHYSWAPASLTLPVSQTSACVLITGPSRNQNWTPMRRPAAL